MVDWSATGKISGINENQTEDRTDGRSGNLCGDEGADQRAYRGRNLEEHPNTNVRESIFQIGNCRAGRSRDHRHQRCAHGIANIDLEYECEQRHEDDAASQPGESAQKTSHERSQSDQNGELEVVQIASETSVP